ncbi:MAG: rhodanese-related sulfurtransferase [Comamonadaceae bacterium]|nr:MAG: rhodanese-related sulfurtransferase [Comamonadaceae bacterium]
MPAAYLTAALYLFVDLPDFAALQEPLQATCDAHGVRGMLLLAPEGINGTIAGNPEGVHAVLAWLRSDARLAPLRHKEALGERMPFYRMRVRLKREIVSMGVPGLNPAAHAGTYVKPEDWNALIDDPEVVVIDTRNHYEVGIGSFARAIDPGTRSFTEFPAWVEQQSAPGGVLAGNPRVAMFCTGGIRCEKSTAYLKSRGFDEVYHLEGGILKYLETVAEEETRWWGDCFVFDERVSVGHGLQPGHHQLCRSCRMPLSEDDCASPHYVPGVSCPYCHGTRSDAQLQALAERERQVSLAAQRGQEHIGNKLAATAAHATPALQPDAVQGLPVLYSFRRCPYAMRARLAIAASGLRCELREVVLRDKPAALLQASPKGTVPVLVLPNGQVLQESLEIMQWALQHSDPGRWLQPAEGSTDDMQALISACDGRFKQALDRCKYPNRYPDADPQEQWAAAQSWLLELESRLARFTHLFGSHASLADMAIAPFVRQFAGIDTARWEAGPWPQVRRWLAAWQAGEALERVMGKYAAWVEGDAPLLFPPA